MATDGSSRRKFFGYSVLGAGGLVGGALALNWSRIPWGFVHQYRDELGRPIGAPGTIPDPSTWPDTGVHATWIGHSTVLMKIDGFTVLTDPILSARAGLNLGPFTIGVKRLVNPALTREQIPQVDLILLSHAHMDHFDLPTLRSLESKGTHVISARNTLDLLRANRFGSAREIGWGERLQAGAAAVTGLEVNHWGARMRTDTYRGYNGYLIEVGKRRVLFAGDTANTESFRRITRAVRPEVAIFPIGAYNPWIHVHCNPEQAWRMANDAGADLVLPVHFKTFVLSREALTEPVERLLNAAGASADTRIGWKEIGATVHLS